MLNFSSVLLLVAAAVYIGQNDYTTFVVFSVMAILGRLASYSIENNTKIGVKNAKKDRKVLQEHIN